MTQSDSNRLPVNRKILARFFSKIQVSTEHFYKGEPCWDWTANKDKRTGYGKFCYAGKKRVAARTSYQMFVALIPSTKDDCDHLCRRRICVNPVHLEAVTHRINCLRGTGQSARNHKKDAV